MSPLSFAKFLDLVDRFQQQLFNTIHDRPKKLEIGKKESVVYQQILPNRDMMPRVSVEIAEWKYWQPVDFRLKFVDIAKTAALSSSLSRSFELNLYAPDPNMCKLNTNRYVKRQSQVVNINKNALLENLTPGQAYLIEVSLLN